MPVVAQRVAHHTCGKTDPNRAGPEFPMKGVAEPGERALLLAELIQVDRKAHTAADPLDGHVGIEKTGPGGSIEPGPLLVQQQGSAKLARRTRNSRVQRQAVEHVLCELRVLL